MSHVLKPGECPECDLMPKEIATLRAGVSRLEAEVAFLKSEMERNGKYHLAICDGLESQRDRAVGLLRQMETVCTVVPCPVCGEGSHARHAPDCALAALLWEVGR